MDSIDQNLDLTRTKQTNLFLSISIHFRLLGWTEFMSRSFIVINHRLRYNINIINYNIILMFSSITICMYNKFFNIKASFKGFFEI